MFQKISGGVKTRQYDSTAWPNAAVTLFSSKGWIDGLAVIILLKSRALSVGWGARSDATQPLECEENIVWITRKEYVRSCTLLTYSNPQHPSWIEGNRSWHCTYVTSLIMDWWWYCFEIMVDDSQYHQILSSSCTACFLSMVYSFSEHLFSFPHVGSKQSNGGILAEVSHGQLMGTCAGVPERPFQRYFWRGRIKQENWTKGQASECWGRH